ncbi:unnamed protein product, partial [Heterosigma akashiwo]
TFSCSVPAWRWLPVRTTSTGFWSRVGNDCAPRGGGGRASFFLLPFGHSRQSAAGSRPS